MFIQNSSNDNRVWRALCASTELVMPWDWRTESKTARKRRQESELQREKEVQQCLEREKYNSIDQYLLSGDEKVLFEENVKHFLKRLSFVKPYFVKVHLCTSP